MDESMNESMNDDYQKDLYSRILAASEHITKQTRSGSYNWRIIKGIHMYRRCSRTGKKIFSIK